MLRSVTALALLLSTGCIVGAYKAPVPPVEEQRQTLLAGSKTGYQVGEISEDLGLISAKTAIAASAGHWLRWRRGGEGTLCFEKGIKVAEDTWGLRDREKRTTKDLNNAAFYVQAHDTLDGKPTWEPKKSAVHSAKLVDEQVQKADITRYLADKPIWRYKGSQTYEVCIAAPQVGPSTRFLTIRSSLYTDGMQLYIWRVRPIDGESPTVADTDAEPSGPASPNLPASGQSLMLTLESMGNYKTLHGWLVDADLDVEIDGPGPFTILAPTDAAFAEWTQKRRDKLQGNKQKLADYLRKQILIGTYRATAEKVKHKAKTLHGDTQPIATTREGLMFSGAELGKPTVAANGLIYKLDTAPSP
jgi:hypothetical protein